MEKKKMLEVKELKVSLSGRKDLQTVIDGISFDLMQGEILGIVGESGSGKTITALSIMDLLSKNMKVTGGSIFLEGTDLVQMKEAQKRAWKGNHLSMIFQEPMTSLNPVMKIGDQIDEMLRLHRKQEKKNRTRNIIDALREVDLEEPEKIYDKYPHQLSGGMRQRVMIAMAMICEPRLLIADEPTTALDVTIQAQILELIRKLNRERGTSVIFISHDLGIIRSLCHRAIVMKTGKIVEQGSTKEIFYAPAHAYTKRLMEAATEGKEKRIRVQAEEQAAQENVLEISHLNVFYPGVRKTMFSRKEKKQVLFDVSFTLGKGEILGIVGESGCGKSTLARTAAGLMETYSGKIETFGHRPQMVFQDPYGSLNPSKTVGWILEEPMKIQGGYHKSQRKERVKEILKQVGLQESHALRYVSQLSGGQRQRVAIACAIICKARLVILDEPVSALDTTVQVQILELLKTLREEYDLSYLFISHDLNVVYRMCDRVCVMYQGRIVETAGIEQIYGEPQHEYTKTLLKAVLV